MPGGAPVFQGASGERAVVAVRTIFCPEVLMAEQLHVASYGWEPQS